MIPTLRTTTDRILARGTDHSARRRGDQAVGRGRAVGRSSTGSTSASRRSTAPRICSTDPHVLRPGGLVNNINADGEPFRVPALPIEWNGSHIGEGLKVPPLGADTAAVRAELDEQRMTSTGKTAGRRA